MSGTKIHVDGKVGTGLNKQPPAHLKAYSVVGHNYIILSPCIHICRNSF